MPPPPASESPAPLRALLSGLIDYAGLYPPASLPMLAAVENYARYLREDHAWMLGRFVCPASRLDELTAAASPLMPGTFATSGYRDGSHVHPWRISIVIDTPLDAALAHIARFNQRHADPDRGHACADAVELKAPGPETLDDTLDAIPNDLFPFFEAPGQTPAENSDPRGLIAALAGSGCAAKIRTGGITRSAFPTAEQVARFITACAAADVPFKATAGLHHPVRAEHALTYEANAERGVMHGFLNVFLGAALVHAGLADENAFMEILRETDPSAFAFTPDAAAWRTLSVPASRIAEARRSLALSFGSCSFEEPVADLQRLGLLL